MNWKSRIRKLTRWRTKNERRMDEERWRTTKNDEEFPQNRLRKRYGSTSTWFFFTKTCFLPKIAEMHSQRGLEHFETAPPSPIYRKKGRCLPPKDLMKKISKRTRITKFTPLFVFYGKVTEALRNCFRIWFSSFFSSLSPMLSGICLPKVFGNFTEVLRKPRKPRKPFFKNVEELAAQLLPP